MKQSPHPACSPAVHLARQLLALVCAAGSASAAGSAPAPFTLAHAQLEQHANGDILESMYSTTFAAVSSEVGFAKARVDFGVHGGHAVIGTSYHNAFAESMWTDALYIDAHAGSYQMDFAVEVNGTHAGGGNAFYMLHVSDAPINCDMVQASCEGMSLIAADALPAGRQILSVQLTVTGGQTLYLASYFGAEVWGGGMADYYHSARLGASVDGGASLLAASGTSYPQASAVPELPTGLLAGVGCLLLVWSMARRRDQATRR
jgi:hypothetical protein